MNAVLWCVAATRTRTTVCENLERLLESTTGHELDEDRQRDAPRLVRALSIVLSAFETESTPSHPRVMRNDPFHLAAARALGAACADLPGLCRADTFFTALRTAVDDWVAFRNGAPPFRHQLFDVRLDEVCDVCQRSWHSRERLDRVVAKFDSTVQMSVDRALQARGSGRTCCGSTPTRDACVVAGPEVLLARLDFGSDGDAQRIWSEIRAATVLKISPYRRRQRGLCYKPVAICLRCRATGEYVASVADNQFRWLSSDDDVIDCAGEELRGAVASPCLIWYSLVASV